MHWFALGGGGCCRWKQLQPQGSMACKQHCKSHHVQHAGQALHPFRRICQLQQIPHQVLFCLLRCHSVPEHTPDGPADLSSTARPLRVSITGTADAAVVAAEQGHAQAHWHSQEKAKQQHERASESQISISTIEHSSIMNITPGTTLAGSTLLPWPETDMAMDSQQQLLCDVLKISPSDAQLLLLSSQAANTLTRRQLSTNWTALQQLLPVQQQQLFRALLRLPDLLHQPQATVNARLADAAKVLKLPSPLLLERGRKAALLRYQLLLMSQRNLENKLTQLVQVLGLKQNEVVKLLCKEPQLLRLPQAQLVSSVEALEQVCGVRLQRLAPHLKTWPHVLSTPAEQLYRTAACLQRQLRLSEEGLALAVRRAPGALCVAEGSVATLLDQLSEGLGVSTDVAVDIVLQEPILLLRSPGAVAGVLGVLRTNFKLDVQSLLQVVQFDPLVLYASPGELESSTSRFKALASLQKAWTAEYSRLMSRPVNVARALRIEPLRLQRLVFLTKHQLAGTLSLKAALTLSGRQFTMAYPSYKAWLANEYSSGDVPRQYRKTVDQASDEEDDDDDL